MPILDIQRRIREVGRIRMGTQEVAANGRAYPKASDKPRFTSADRQIIEAVANAFGGEVKPWRNGDADEWEVIVEARSIPIALPPEAETMAFSQWHEVWGNKVCKQRCDGAYDTVRDCPCDCDPANRICKATTRLSVLVPDIAGLGLWRIESHGYYAAVELGAAIALLAQLAGMHSIVPARLRIERRESRRLIDGKPETRKYVVPVIDIDVSIKAVQAIGAGAVSAPAPELPPATWQPVPQEEAPAALSVATQLAELDQPAKPPRKGTTKLKPTGNAPRTAAEANEPCSVCGKALSGEPVQRNKGTGSKFIHKSCAEDVPRGVASDASDDDGGGGGASPTPPPVATPSSGRRMAGHDQLKAVFAIGARLFPALEGQTGDETRTMRREQVLAICAALGCPPYDSRKDLDRASATVLVDTLKAIEDGTVLWNGEHLANAETGEVIGFEKPA